MCDSKVVAIYYLIFSFFWGLVGYSFSMMISLELSVPFSLIGESFYYLSVTSHGVIMVFFFLTTLASVFSNYLMPGLLGLEDMYYPKLNVFSFVLLIPCSLLMVISFLGEGVKVGWTAYVPLSNLLFSGSFSLDLFMLSVHLFSLSSLLGSINVLASVFFVVNSFESFVDFSSFIWGYIMTSLLVIFSVPSLTCVLTMLFFDSNFGTYYFGAEFGGDVMLYQVMFWFWGHPEVYMLILPVFSVVSHVLNCLLNGGLYNVEGIVFSMMSLGMLSFLVWGHHMVTVGWSLESSGFFMVSTVVMSMPTGVKMFSWLFSFYLGCLGFSLVVICLFMFVVFFCFGGVTGMFLSNTFLDVLFQDSYFVVGHFHYVLSLAALFGFFSGLFYFFSDFFNLCNSLSVDKSVISWLLFVFLFWMLNIMFLFFHTIGGLGYPSSISSYVLSYFSVFYMSSIGFLGLWFFVFMLLSSFMVCFIISFS